MNVLVDTSVWSLALRRRSEHLSSSEQTIVAELAELIHEGRARIIGVVRQELLSGIKIPAQFQKLREILASFPDEPISTPDFEGAAELGNQCRNHGISTSSPDMLICAIAKSRGWAVFSTDPDFSRYAKVLSFSLHTPRP